MLTGCWDNVPIEDRGFVIGSAIDLKDGKVDGNYDLTLTNQFVVPPGLNSPMNGGSGGKAFMNLSGSGDSVFAIDQEMASLTSKMPFFEHLKLLVVSDELLETPHLFADVLDVFVRDKEMRRGVKVVAAKGEAKDILGIQPENEQLPAVYINNLLEVSMKKTNLFKPMHVGDIHQMLLTNSSFIIPYVIAAKNKVDYKGGAIFHGYEDRLVGFLDEKEMTALNLVNGDTHGGTITFTYGGDLITFKINNAKSDVKLDTKDPERINITVDIGVEGGIAEVFGNKNLNNSQTLSEIEKEISKQIETMTGQTIARTQKEMNADIFAFDQKLNERHYHTWQKIKDNWDHGENLFAKSNIRVNAKAHVRTAGASEKVEGNRKE